MKVDIIKRKGDYAVFPRSSFEGDEYENEPMFVNEDEYECVLWCEDNGHSFRFRRNAVLVRPAFLKDVEKKLDGWREGLDAAAGKCGRRLESHCTYRASAAWKDEPIHYCYFGDMGGVARLVKTDEGAANADNYATATQYLDFLMGAADALWELGLTVTYDKDGKHTLYGVYPEWVTTDNAE